MEAEKVMATFFFRRLDTNESITVEANGKNHARAKVIASGVPADAIMPMGHDGKIRNGVKARKPDRCRRPRARSWYGQHSYM